MNRGSALQQREIQKGLGTMVLMHGIAPENFHGKSGRDEEVECLAAHLGYPTLTNSLKMNSW